MKQWKKWWDAHEWPILVFVAFLSMVIGYIGFVQYFSRNGTEAGALDILYLTIQLFTMNSGSQDGTIPLCLNIARYLAPLTIAFAAIKAFLWLMRDQVKRLRLNRVKGHVVIAGANPMVSGLISDFLTKNQSIVVVDEIIAIPDEQKHHPNLMAVCGDPGDPEVLLQSRFRYAKTLICLTSHDASNLAAATAAVASFPQNQLNTPPSVFCHISNPRTIEQLNYLDFFGKGRTTNGTSQMCSIQVFNIFERASRLLLEKFAPDKSLPDLQSNTQQLHIVVAGLTVFGEAVLLQLARMAHYVSLTKTRVTILDPSEATCADFIHSYPNIGEILEIHYLQELSPDWKDDDVTQLIACFDQDTDTLGLLQRLHPVEKKHYPVIIATTDHTHFLNAFSANNIHHFNIYDETLTADVILKEKIDDLARIIHADYLEDQKKGKTFNPEKPTHREWHQLAERTKNQNRNQADHLWVKVRAAGCVINDKMEEGVPYDFASDPVLFERLAEAEHNRWMAHELLTDNKKQHVSLVPYGELTDEVKQWDRNAVKNIPRLLDRIGLKAVKAAMVSEHQT